LHFQDKNFAKKIEMLGKKRQNNLGFWNELKFK